MVTAEHNQTSRGISVFEIEWERCLLVDIKLWQWQCFVWCMQVCVRSNTRSCWSLYNRPGTWV